MTSHARLAVLAIALLGATALGAWTSDSEARATDDALPAICGVEVVGVGLDANAIEPDVRQCFFDAHQRGGHAQAFLIDKWVTDPYVTLTVWTTYRGTFEVWTAEQHWEFNGAPQRWTCGNLEETGDDEVFVATQCSNPLPVAPPISTTGATGSPVMCGVEMTFFGPFAPNEAGRRCLVEAWERGVPARFFSGHASDWGGPISSVYTVTAPHILDVYTDDREQHRVGIDRCYTLDPDSVFITEYWGECEEINDDPLAPHDR